MPFTNTSSPFAGLTPDDQTNIFDILDRIIGRVVASRELSHASGVRSDETYNKQSKAIGILFSVFFRSFPNHPRENEIRAKHRNIIENSIILVDEQERAAEVFVSALIDLTDALDREQEACVRQLRVVQGANRIQDKESSFNNAKHIRNVLDIGINAQARYSVVCEQYSEISKLAWFLDKQSLSVRQSLSALNSKCRIHMMSNIDAMLLQGLYYWTIAAMNPYDKAVEIIKEIELLKQQIRTEGEKEHLTQLMSVITELFQEEQASADDTQRDCKQIELTDVLEKTRDFITGKITPNAYHNFAKNLQNSELKKRIQQQLYDFMTIMLLSGWLLAAISFSAMMLGAPVALAASFCFCTALVTGVGAFCSSGAVGVIYCSFFPAAPNKLDRAIESFAQAHEACETKKINCTEQVSPT